MIVVSSLHKFNTDYPLQEKSTAVTCSKILPVVAWRWMIDDIGNKFTSSAAVCLYTKTIVRSTELLCVPFLGNHEVVADTLRPSRNTRLLYVVWDFLGSMRHFQTYLLYDTEDCPAPTPPPFMSGRDGWRSTCLLRETTSLLREGQKRVATPERLAVLQLASSWEKRRLGRQQQVLSDIARRCREQVTHTHRPM